jgi:hypothetical protein
LVIDILDKEPGDCFLVVHVLVHVDTIRLITEGNEESEVREAYSSVQPGRDVGGSITTSMESSIEKK